MEIAKAMSVKPLTHYSQKITGEFQIIVYFVWPAIGNAHYLSERKKAMSLRHCGTALCIANGNCVNVASASSPPIGVRVACSPADHFFSCDKFLIEQTDHCQITTNRFQICSLDAVSRGAIETVFQGHLTVYLIRE